MRPKEASPALVARLRSESNRLHHISMIHAGDFASLPWAPGAAQGMVPYGAPGLKGVRDVADIALVLRAEMNALVALLIRKGVFSQEEWVRQCIEDTMWLTEAKEKQFNVRATETGLTLNPSPEEPEGANDGQHRREGK